MGGMTMAVGGSGIDDIGEVVPGEVGEFTFLE
jgi:hypothetical protein